MEATSTVDLVAMIGQYGFMIVLLVLFMRGEVIPKKSVDKMIEAINASTELLAKKLLEGIETTIKEAVRIGVRDGLEEIVHRKLLIKDEGGEGGK